MPAKRKTVAKKSPAKRKAKTKRGGKLEQNLEGMAIDPLL